MAKAGSPLGEGSMPKMMKSFTIKALGKQKENVVDPEVFKEAFKAASCAEEKNEKAFDNLEGATEKEGLEDTAEFKEFWDKQERTSPMMLLADQNRGYNLQPEWTPPPQYQARPRGPISTSFTSLRMT